MDIKKIPEIAYEKSKSAITENPKRLTDEEGKIIYILYGAALNNMFGEGYRCGQEAATCVIWTVVSVAERLVPDFTFMSMYYDLLTIWEEYEKKNDE